MVIAGSMIMWSCSNSGSRSGRAGVPDMHTSEISLDWHGSYSGNLPCADCERIESELTLNDDLSYMLVSIYHKGAETLADTIAGSFHWEGSKIMLEGIPPHERSPWFRVEEGQVRCLDMEGEVITGELENFYILRKEGNPLVENRRWQLVEINGRPVEGTPDTHFLLFDPSEGMAAAKADCNVMMFSYKIRNELQVRFGQGLSTLMACPDNDLEEQLVSVLLEADNLSTDGTFLTLNKARMAPLARFILAEEEQEQK